MDWFVKLMIGFVAAQHLLFFYIETFAWKTLGKKLFRKQLTDDGFNSTANLAANQGLYNAFLAAGLIWSFFINDQIWIDNLRFFFLGCIILAGCFGGWSVSRRIFVVQAVPSIITILLILLHK